MENQSQRNQISTDDVYPKRDGSTSNTKWSIPQADNAKYLGLHLDRRLN